MLVAHRHSNRFLPMAGAFVAPDGKALPVAESLPNAHMRLFGGAQYHRAMAEFRTCVGELVCPDIRWVAAQVSRLLCA